MKCSCPWCDKEVVPGLFSLGSESPTCEEHSAEAVLSMFSFPIVTMGEPVVHKSIERS